MINNNGATMQYHFNDTNTTPLVHVPLHWYTYHSTGASNPQGRSEAIPGWRQLEIGGWWWGKALEGFGRFRVEEGSG
ncbi:unnamed protein product [Linum trigynum]|uniref:Uncharacterized protein n=1 Tax=Linum trigynum TaxID=586398 RepID=A0AAV2DWU2_9ROSI